MFFNLKPRVPRQRKKDLANMENFAQLLEEYSAVQEMNQGEVITAEVVAITDKHVIVNAGLKSESLIDINEFKNLQGEVEVKVGDFVTVTIESVENGFGETKLSREKAKRAADWIALEEAMENGDILSGLINGKVKGGLTVMINSIRAFLPGSLLDVRPIKDTSHFEGKEIEFKVIKLDKKRNNVVVSRRAVLEATLGEDPWSGLARRYPQGTRLFGKVSNLTDYGAFVEIEQGIEGLVHVSEMDWTNKNVHPSKVVQLGDEVEVMILEIDEDRRRISLGMKQCQANPWEDFDANYNKGDKIKGAVKSITDFGVFVGLPGNIDGLVHLSDLSWTETGEEAVRKYKKGEEVETVVLAIDVEKERISLGIKQLEGDPFGNYISVNDKGSLVKGTVKSVEAKGAVIVLGDEVEGYLPASEFAADRVEDLTTKLNEGDAVEAVIVTVDRKNRSIKLSVKAKDAKESRDALNSVNAASTASAGTTSLGDLLKAKLSGDQE